MGRKSTYSESYKREAVAKAEASRNVSQTARELGIATRAYTTGSGSTVYRWTSRPPV
jgi:transposase-like protein